MMNKTQIEYCDFVFNPVTGCLKNCNYCYAMGQMKRFSGDVRLNKGSQQLKRITKDLYVLPDPFHNSNGKVLLYPVGKTPTLHEYRLPMPAQKKKPAVILVCSMADLFGEWVPDEWIERVFDACAAASWHRYLFLTKNPERYASLANAGILPMKKNYWYGTTITSQGETPFGAAGYNTFVCAEPLMGDLFSKGYNFNGASWVLIGAETGERRSKVKPELQWIDNIVATCKKNHVPLFMRTSHEICVVWKKPLIQELPEGLVRGEDEPTPHCKECQYATWVQQGKRGKSYSCNATTQPAGKPKHIDGRYTRTSPPWCAMRKNGNKVGTLWEQKNEQNTLVADNMNNTGRKSTKNHPKIMGDKVKSQSGSEFGWM